MLEGPHPYNAPTIARLVKAVPWINSLRLKYTDSGVARFSEICQSFFWMKFGIE
jgi:hypothetical protein